MKHDAWVNDLFWVTQLKLEPSGPLSHAHMSSVLCDLCNDRTCEECGVRPFYCHGIQISSKRKKTCLN